MTSPLDLPPSGPDNPRPFAPTGGPQPGYVPYQPLAFDAADPLRRPETEGAFPGYYTPDPAAALAVRPAAAVPPPITSPRYISTPEAPYGRDPATGEPLSNKNRYLAGLLQLIFGAFGAGRFYIGDTRTGFITIGLVVAAIFLTVYLPFGWILWPALGLWWISDFILMFSGHVHDSDGRKLR